MRAKIACGFGLLLSACVADADDVELEPGAEAEPPPAEARANIPIILLEDHFDDSSRGEWEPHGTQDPAHNDGVFIALDQLWMIGRHKSWVSHIYSFHHSTSTQPWFCHFTLKAAPIFGSESFKGRLKVVDAITRETIANVAFPALPTGERTTVTTGGWWEPPSGAVDLLIIRDDQTSSSWIAADDARLTCTGVSGPFGQY